MINELNVELNSKKTVISNLTDKLADAENSLDKKDRMVRKLREEIENNKFDINEKTNIHDQRELMCDVDEDDIRHMQSEIDRRDSSSEEVKSNSHYVSDKNKMEDIEKFIDTLPSVSKKQHKHSYSASSRSVHSSNSSKHRINGQRNNKTTFYGWLSTDF